MDELKKKLGRDADAAITSNNVAVIEFIAGNPKPFVDACKECGIITRAFANELNDQYNNLSAHDRARKLVGDVQTTVKYSPEYLDKFLVILVDQGGPVGKNRAADIVKCLKLNHDLQAYYGLVGDNKVKGIPAIFTDSKEEDSKKVTTGQSANIKESNDKTKVESVKIEQSGGTDETDNNTKGQSHGIEETDGKTIAQGGNQPDSYNISTKQGHGIALIITNIKWQKDLKFKDRSGAEDHEKRLSETFKKLGYNVVCHRNFTGQKMKDCLSSLAEYWIMDEHDSFICCISSHGDASCVVGVDGVLVKVGDLAKIVNGSGCPKLNGKPKMFFIQACRGKEVSAPVPVDNGGLGATEVDILTDSGKRSLPSEADFIFGFSTCQDKVAVRSAYIKVLCETFDLHASRMSLYDMMILVNDKVSQTTYQVQLSSENTEDHQQIPEIVSRLRKKVFFKQ